MRIKIISVAVGCLLTASCGGTADHKVPAPTADATAATPTSSPGAAHNASPAATSATDDELKAAVQAYSDAFLTGDSKTAYALLSERCRKRTTPAEFAGIAATAKQVYGSALPIDTFSASTSGDLARVTYTYSIKAINQDSEPWVREAGNWHEDDC